MDKTEFIERAAKAYKSGCPELTDAEATYSAEALWNCHNEEDLNDLSPEDMAHEDMSYWDDDENT